MSNLTREQENELLKKNSALSLPDDPTSKQWSPRQNKRILSNGLFLLKEWLDDLRDDVGNTVVGVSYDLEENTISFTYNNGETDTFEIGTGNANIYYDDTVPQNASKLKEGDLYFDEDDN